MACAETTIKFLRTLFYWCHIYKVVKINHFCDVYPCILAKKIK